MRATCPAYLNKYDWGYQIKEDKIRVCSTHGREKKCIHNLSLKTWREETTWKTYVWMGWYYQNGSQRNRVRLMWIGLIWIRIRFSGKLLWTVTKLRVLYKAGNFLTSWATMKFSRTLLNAVIYLAKKQRWT
jgi:hypothetical protein